MNGPKASLYVDEKPAIKEEELPSISRGIMDDEDSKYLSDPAFQDILAKFNEIGRKHASKFTSPGYQSESEIHSGTARTESTPVDQQKPQDETRLSNRQRKKLNRMSVAQLKDIVRHPEVVELHDPNSKDAELLVYLKSYRNTVPVPGHWILKRKYLSAKRGIEKSQYVLPSYIEATGVAVQRDAYLAEEAKKSRKQKQREKIRPRMGKVSLNIQELWDAFFLHQTKPENLSIHGDIYYEGKEYEINKSKYKPGHISAQLREALGMTPLNSKTGAAAIEPPPWLYKMEEYGPPPSYPNLRIPGVNAPIPVHLGAQYGFQTNGWGKPPVDKV